jgi:hypothetical protein
MMVLNRFAMPRSTVPRQVELRSEIVGMRIMDDHIRFTIVKPAKGFGLIQEPLATTDAVEIANVRSKDRLMTIGHRDRDFLLGPNRDRGRVCPDVKWKGRNAPARTDGHDTIGDDPYNAVIDRSDDLAIVMQVSVRNIRETLLDFVLAILDRFTIDITTGDHQRNADRVKKKEVQRRCGKHQADVTQARIYGWCKDRTGVTAGNHDRAAGAADRFTFALRQASQLLRGIDVDHHDRQRLGGSMLPQPQPNDGSFVGGIADELITADSFDRNDAAVENGVDRGLHRRVSENLPLAAAVG